MNRIFKVIWSKTKHCYIVVSEYAKANTKAVHTGLRTTAAAAAVAAMLLAPVNYNYAWAADTVTVEEADTSTTTQQTQTVYTTDGADKTFATKADAAVQDAGVVKADKKIGENVTALGKGLYDETAARIGADAAQDKVIQKVNENLVQSVNTINKNVADGFTALNTADANEAKARTDADAAEKAAREVGDTTLDTRITKVKEYLENQTSENYVSKTDAAVQDGAIVKADKTIGENVTNLDAALAKETADRIGADAAQDKVIQQVNENAAAGIKTLTEAYNNEVAARQSADTNLQTNIDNEAAARKAADGKLVDAVNSGLSLSNDNVLQKNTTAIDDQGNVTTSKTAANEMILNKDGDNRITLSDKGIKVGLNSTVQDFKGFYAGGDNAEAAKAALNAGGSIKGANGAFTVDVNGNVTSTTTITGKTVTDGKGASMTDGTVTGKTLTDGIATITNGNISTSGTVTGGTVTSTGNISALGDIHAGGAITGASASIQSALTAGSATITGDLTAGGAIQGKSISDGTATMQNGNITGVKNLSAETITTSGDATIGGDLTVNGKLNVDEIDLTKNGIVDGNNVTASTEVAAGEITSYKKVAITKDGSEKESAIDYDENGTSTWAKATDADGNWNKSTLIVEGNDVKSKVVDSERNSNLSTQTSTQSQSTLTDKDSNTNVSTQTVSESSSVVSGKDGEKTYKSYITQNMKKILQGIKEGSNESTVDQTETGIKSTATDGKNTASTNLSNKGFNTYATDGTNKTYTLQTAESLTSQIGDDGKVKSVMNADGITNNADGGTITNSAKELVNTATGNMTNTVGGKLLNDVTGDMENKVGGNLTTTVSGTSTETVTGKKTETYNDGLETTVTGEEKHTVNGSQTNTIGGSQTTTVTGDSSLTAENITNEAKNKITNKALDVETDATSSIVQKVTNAAGSNTSTQLSYQTTEEMKAGGKTASYLRGAAEEKSQLINGSEKTTIDTIAGQTNSNITDGTNTSNDLQKADQIASSVTDGTNTTVVNQNAGSLASSITDGTKVNNSSNTVDKSEQLIKASDTQYSATSKTATKMEDALVSGSSVIDVTKNLDDAANPFIGSAVTDGTNSTGVTQTAKDITNTAEKGTIANNAKDIINNATENMTTTVGGEMKTTVTGKVTEDYKSDLDTKVGGNETHAVTGNQTVTVSKDRTVNVKGTETENFNAQVTNVKTDQRTSVGRNQTNIVAGNQQNTVSGSKTESVKGAVTETYGSQSTTVNGNQSNTVKGTLTETVTGDVTEDYKANLSTTVGGKQTTTVTGDSSLTAKNINNKATKALTNEAETITNKASESVTTQIGDGTAVKSEMTADGITNTAEGGTIYNKSKDILNEVSGDILNFADGEIGNAATKITNLTGDNTVTSDTNGTTFENKAHSTTVKEGTITKTTISGNTITTGEAVMDYADVMKDLGVRGNAAVDGNTTLGKKDADTTLTVNSKSTFKDTVKMEKTLEVDRTSNFNDKVTVTKGGLNVTGGTTTDTLHVTSTSTFDSTATFKDIVTMEKDLSVGGNATVAGDVTANSYKVRDKTYINANGINANGQKITNVAAGTEDSDAANYGQLRKVETRVDGVENRVTNVENRVDKMDSRIDKVGANAAAMANLHPLEFDEDSKWNVAAAVGNYKGETATAVGAFYRPNEDVMFNLSTTFGNDENMVGGGLSLRLGKGGNREKDKKLKAAIVENNDLRAKVNDLTARMDALLSVINPNMSKEFPDVPENHWAYEAVTRLAGNDIVQGYEDGKFHGERTMTRYEMAELIYNALSRGAKAEKKLVEEFKPELQAMAAQKQAK
ncbi:ESPR-type extended signal peptide-containing protein [Mitsuokella jalaludinii]|uniref:ESPR-type extended signal peptide-containing protein n=1 Tax=Mitsuokella jalaludinii TaxID=187979 RepID=UPI002FDAF5F9